MKNARWIVRDEKSEAEVWLYGVIGEDWYDDGVSAMSFVEDLNALPPSIQKVVVRINSLGGDVFQAFAMYQALLRRKSQILVTIDGVAASAASVVAMAGDEINAGKTSMVMIHDPWTVTVGNERDHAQNIQVLKQVKESILTAYTRRDVDREILRAAMEAETWYSAEQAKTVGLVDSVTEETYAIAARIPPGRYRNAPAWLVATNPPEQKPLEMKKRLAAAERILQLVGP